ncbi:recombinase family protein [Methylorubrum extorquens]
MIGYARVSTQDQNPEMQVDALQLAGCERLFVEKASGAQRDRPAMQAALELAKAGDATVVWRLDRIARSLSQLIATFDDLERRRIGLRSLTEAIDTTTSGGKLVFHIFGALAEFERSIIRERTLAGLIAARARGRLGGRPKRLSSADLDVARVLLQDGTLTVSEVAARLGVTTSTIGNPSSLNSNTEEPSLK